MTSTDLTALKVHTDPKGFIWYLDGDKPPINSKLKLNAFLSSELYTHDHMRIVGTYSNVPLILKRFAIGKLLEVCSPGVCHSRSELLNPARTLLNARIYNLPASSGGWHTFNEDDAVSYMLYLGSHQKYIPNLSLLIKHPAWSSLSFIPHLNLAACSKLLGLILDPRWFIDIRNVNRGARLRKFLGLDPSTLKGVMGNGSQKLYHDRCKLVFECWNGRIEKGKADDPRYFLQRIVRHHKDDLNKGILRASQKFVEFVRLTWLAALQRNKQADPLFVPQYFFKRPDEAEAFTEYLHTKRVDTHVQQSDDTCKW